MLRYLVAALFVVGLVFIATVDRGEENNRATPVESTPDSAGTLEQEPELDSPASEMNRYSSPKYNFVFDTKGVELANLAPEIPLEQSWSLEARIPGRSALTISVNDPDVWSQLHPEMGAVLRRPIQDQATRLWIRNSTNFLDAAAFSYDVIRKGARSATTSELQSTSISGHFAYSFTISGLSRDYFGGISVLPQGESIRELIIDAEPFPSRITYDASVKIYQELIDSLVIED